MGIGIDVGTGVGAGAGTVFKCLAQAPNERRRAASRKGNSYHHLLPTCLPPYQGMNE